MVVVRTAHNHERLTISAGARSAERAHRQLVPLARGERLVICTDLNHGHLLDLLSPDARAELPLAATGSDDLGLVAAQRR